MRLTVSLNFIDQFKEGLRGLLEHTREIVCYNQGAKSLKTETC